jgi:hypothetical protein
MLEVRYAKSVGNVSDSFHRLQAQAVVRNLLDAPRVHHAARRRGGRVACGSAYTASAVPVIGFLQPCIA